MNGLFGWQLAAARAACALSFRDVSAQSGVASSRYIAIEKLDEIEVRENNVRGDGGVLPDTLQRIIECYQSYGLELRPATSSKPAAVVCIDADKLSRRRRSEFKGRARAREA